MSLLSVKSVLETGLKSLGFLELNEPLFHYLTLLDKWNAAYNLTAIRDPQEMIHKHLLDSLIIAPWLQGQAILDVGTGPGLPGIPLALANPNLQFTLLDSNGKKTRFLQEVKRQLTIKNLEIVQIRVENFRPALGFDTVVSRAFSNLEQMIFWTKHLLKPQGLWLAMKGRYPETELEQLTYPFHVKQYAVEGVEGERCCVLINNNNN